MAQVRLPTLGCGWQTTSDSSDLWECSGQPASPGPEEGHGFFFGPSFHVPLGTTESGGNSTLMLHGEPRALSIWQVVELVS